MTNIFQHSGSRINPPTWDQFKSSIRKTDRDSLLSQAAATTARIASDGLSGEEAKYGLTPWAIADVARTSLAWGSFTRPEANLNVLAQLCHVNVNLGQEGLDTDLSSSDLLGRVLARTFLEQFPGQRSIMADLSRSLLLFGSAAEHESGFVPEVMSPGWFESVSDGLTLEEYVEALFLIYLIAQKNGGKFSLDWLDSPAYQSLGEVISLDSIRRTFSEHLSTTIKTFKVANRLQQDSVPYAYKKFAFNPLANRPFITDVGDVPLAPWVQAIVAKAFPPGIYHLARPKLGDAFTHDLGRTFQHYAGRQLGLIEGDRQVLPEVAYGASSKRIDSCDWLLDLPGVLVLVECKARQPIESLRIGGSDWLNSIEGSINKGIRQLNRSNRDILEISAVCPRIDSSKPRVGLVVTLEPFYVSQNWLLEDHLMEADLPVGIISIAELESLVLLNADELAQMLLNQTTSQGNLMPLKVDSAVLHGRENPLLVSTWESIDLFVRTQNRGASPQVNASEKGGVA